MSRSLIVSLVLLGITQLPAAAQTCLGLAPFSKSAVQVTAEGALAQGSDALTAGLGYGLPRGVFGGLAVGTRSVEAFDGSSLDLGAGVGYQVPVARTTQLELCPVASFNLGIGPNSRFGAGVDRSSRAASIGLALGASLRGGPRMQIVPTVGLRYFHGKSWAENSAGATLFEIAENYGRAQVGVGIVVSSNISVRPTVDFPISPSGTEPTVALTVGYNFGRKVQN
jgi:hypothetical protein